MTVFRWTNRNSRQFRYPGPLPNGSYLGKIIVPIVRYSLTFNKKTDRMVLL